MRDYSKFAKGIFLLILQFVFDLPVRIVKFLVLFAVTCVAVVFLGYIIYFVIELFINLFLNFSLEGESRWVVISGISFWFGVYWAIVDDKKNNPSTLETVRELLDFSRYRIKYNNLMIDCGLRSEFKIHKYYYDKIIYGGTNNETRLRVENPKVIPKFWEAQKAIKISDLKKSKEIEVLEEEPKGWLKLKNANYSFVAKYGTKEKKSKTVQIFSRKTIQPIDVFGHEKEGQGLLNHMTNNEPEFINQDEFDKLWSDKGYLDKNINEVIRKYYDMKHSKGGTLQSFEKQNEVSVLKKEIQDEFDSFFKCLEKIGKTKIIEDKEYKP